MNHSGKVGIMVAMKPTTAASRLLALDYLRGFFIVVIIVDHLWRWPNLFQFVSGRGELWASAAEGFVIISGLLIGYIRGYKNRNLPLIDVSKKLVKRGLLLYLWMLITTLGIVAASWAFTYQGGLANIPYNTADWSSLIIGVLRLDFVHSLTHFLYLYAIFLVISPLVVWLLRRSLAWIVAIGAVGVWWLGIVTDTEWMQWQILFFIPAIAGFYLEPLRSAFNQLSSRTKNILTYGSIVITLVTIIIAGVIVFQFSPGAYTQTLFTREPVTLARVGISFVWFIGLFSLFQTYQGPIGRFLGWLLLPFGTKSLTAYIVHPIPLMLCSFFLGANDNFWFNTLLASSCILGVWAIIKIPHINRVIPR